jgi:hypothetical protein
MVFLGLERKGDGKVQSPRGAQHEQQEQEELVELLHGRWSWFVAWSQR